MSNLHYKLLGVVQTQLTRLEMQRTLEGAGWSVHSEFDDGVALCNPPFYLSLEGERSVLIEATFSGQPETLERLMADLSPLCFSYALDLTGDSARLVRRLIA